MQKKYPDELKAKVIRRYEKGESIQTLCQERAYLKVHFTIGESDTVPSKLQPVHTHQQSSIPSHDDFKKRNISCSVKSHHLLPPFLKICKSQISGAEGRDSGIALSFCKSSQAYRLLIHFGISQNRSLVFSLKTAKTKINSRKY